MTELKIEMSTTVSSTPNRTRMNLGEMREHLEDVRYMTAFLQRAFMVWNEADYAESPEEREGFLIVLRIIGDKAEAVSEALAPASEVSHE